MDLSSEMKFREEISTNKKVENILAEIAGYNKNDSLRNIAPPLDSQQQLQNLLANVLTRKLSWDTNSSHEEMTKEPFPIQDKQRSSGVLTSNNSSSNKDNDKEPIEYSTQTNGIILDKTSGQVGFVLKFEIKVL